VLLAYRAAVASPRVTAAAVEATEFPALADRFAVMAVPKTVLDDQALFEGAVGEAVFIRSLLTAANAGVVTDPSP
jgi:predicted phage tail protein